jgi:putative transcriptional regulator
VATADRPRYDPSLPLAVAIARYFRTTVEEIFHVD